MKHYRQLTQEERYQISTLKDLESYLETAYNFRLTDVQAAMGVEHLKRLPGLIEKRCEIAAIYHKELKGVVIFYPQQKNHELNYQCFYQKE